MNRSKYPLSFYRIVRCVFIIAIFTISVLASDSSSRYTIGEIAVPSAQASAPIQIHADAACRWKEGEYEVWLLQGNCRITQGNTVAYAADGVVWLNLNEHSAVLEDPFQGQPSIETALVYLEGDASVHFQRGGSTHSESGKAAQSIYDQQWFGRFRSSGGIHVHVGLLRGKPATDLPTLRRAKSYRRNDLSGQVQPVQWIDESNGSVLSNQNYPDGSRIGPTQSPYGSSPYETQFNQSPSNQDRSNQGPVSLPPARDYNIPFGPSTSSMSGPAETRVRFLPRGSRAPSLKSFPSSGGTEQIWIATGGVKVVIESDRLTEMNSIDAAPNQRAVIEADEVVAWTNSLAPLRADGQPIGQSDKRWELYLEGNIVFASGRRVVYADRMYYDTLFQRGTILNAEMLTPVPNYEGLVRMKADVLQQMNQNTFQAFGAAVTTSRMGVPRYWIQSNDIQFTQSPGYRTDPYTGQYVYNPQTGQPEIDPNYLVSARGNQVYAGNLPLFYWPSYSTDLKATNRYLNNVAFKSDNVFGQQLLTEWNLLQLFGIQNAPSTTKWSGDIDFLSKRGPAVGTNFRYGRNSVLGLAGPYQGELDIWGIKDDGLDNLGLDRRALIPEETFRGRLKYKHRHRFGDGYQFTAEAGYISDRDFLEQYYEREWDSYKDQITALQLKRLYREHSFNVEGSIRLNEFFMQTESLPRFDHFVLGRSIADLATWHAHSVIGYQRLQTASTPQSPANQAKFTQLPWEADVEGVRASTRQEIDFPFFVGPVKAVPYLLGEMSYWGEDLTGSSLSRAYGQVGMRSSLPIWRANNQVQSTLLNVNGLTHKVNFESDIFYADASEDMTQLPMYDPLDEDAQEAFRRRFTFDSFGGAVPFRFDPRSFAFRSLLQRNVSSPSTEVADDLLAISLGVNQRWQTKRGVPGNQRIIDWITLDVGATIFPKTERDNFGAPLGALNYDFRFHVGDRVSILSDGYFDFFGQGLRTGSIGVLATRPEVGNIYVGFRSIEGPISSNVVSSNYTYRMSDKWIVSAGSSFDLGPAGNLGQRLVFTRIGESFLMNFGINSDVSRKSVGFVFGLQPRFYTQSRATVLGGVPLPPVGARGLE